MYKNRKRRNAVTIVSLALIAMLAHGCTKDPYRAAIQGSADVSQAVSSAIKITTVYYSNGTINDSAKSTVASYLNLVTDCNMAFRKSVVSIHSSGATGKAAYLPVADVFVFCAASAPPLVNDATIQNYLKAVKTAIDGIALAVQSAKGA